MEVRTIAINATRRLVASVALWTCAGWTLAQTPAHPCLAAAAGFHGVSSSMLAAVMTVDARQQSSVGTLSAGGALDLGRVGQAAVAELPRIGVAPPAARQQCLHHFASGWLLARTIATYGNTWSGIASYWSTTTYFNYRARAMLNNELVAAGAVNASPMQVPSVRPSESPWAPGFSQLEIQQFIFHN